MAWSSPEIPFNDLPNLPPREKVETDKVLKRAINASRYLAELKGSCLRLPNPHLLLNTIMLQESKESSAIENIVTTQDALYQAIANVKPSDSIAPEIKEVLRYKHAILIGKEEMSKTGLMKSSLAVSIVQKLRGAEVGFRNQAGTQLANPQTQKVIYTPPEWHLVPDKMAAWEEFVNVNDEYDPLVKLSLMHYQFEAIHPFSDGNGRTGRILNVLFLVKENLLTLPVLYHSSYIIQHKKDYYRLLREVTEKENWEDWIIFMLDAIAETSRRTLTFIDEMLKLKEETLQKIKTLSSQLPWSDLNELLFSYPYIKIAILMERRMGTRPTVTRYLEDLVSMDVLKVTKIGRENYYINHKLMNLIISTSRAL